MSASEECVYSNALNNALKELDGRRNDHITLLELKIKNLNQDVLDLKSKITNTNTAIKSMKARLTNETSFIAPNAS